jgi:hypothetical protein
VNQSCPARRTPNKKVFDREPRAGWAALLLPAAIDKDCGLPPFSPVFASHPMGSCSSKEPAVAESQDAPAASPPAPREPEFQKSLLPETKVETAKQHTPTTEPPKREEEDEGLGYDQRPNEEVCLFVRALFSDIFVKSSMTFWSFSSACMLSYLFLRFKIMWPARCRKKVQSLLKTRTTRGHEDPQADSRFIISTSS